MQIEKKDIEEVGEAVEALGVMIETQLHKINLQLNQLNKSISEIISQEKNLKEEIFELRSQISTGVNHTVHATGSIEQETKELLEGLEATASRSESRISELQRIFKEEEDHTTGIKNDLLIIKRDLQFVRSDLKEILNHGEYLDKKLKDLENRVDGLENEKFT